MNGVWDGACYFEKATPKRHDIVLSGQWMYCTQCGDVATVKDSLAATVEWRKSAEARKAAADAKDVARKAKMREYMAKRKAAQAQAI
jgi:hypothetical protein